MAERLLRTSYRKEMALWPTRVSKFWVLLLLAFLVVFPLLATDFVLTVGISVVIAAIGALGLNLLSGFAGQISLGHAFFIAVGVFVGTTVASQPGTSTLSGVEFWGLGMPWWVAVIVGGLAAAAIGIVIGPTAVRLHGLYLSLVTLGLVFLGEFLFKSSAFEKISGSARGRAIPPVSLPWFGWDEKQQLYFGALIVAVIGYLVGKNIARSRVGRAFQATRDRDIAAEIIGVNVTWAKLVAFGISSFYAGAAGVLFGSFLNHALAENFNLLLSIRYIAMIVIGGIGTVLGAALGAFFVVALPELVRNFSNRGWLPFVAETGQGSFDQAAFSIVLFGLFIIMFLVFEPYGLYGLWLRLRNYWKGWPFTY
ncbi:MAG: branched-chain amino acid ABC transporter permease [Acidimicrobiia bacterium]